MNIWLTTKLNININSQPESTKNEIVSFHDDTSQWDYQVPSNPDSTYTVADMDDATFANFLSRPIKIKTLTWSQNSDLFSSFDPWQLFFQNPRVVNRISNFNLMRSKLCIKVVINGNPFYYGRAMLTYTPLQLMDFLTKDRVQAFCPDDLVEASQRPHIFLDPSTSQGGVLRLPFVYPYNAVSIVESQWNGLGELTLRSLQRLKHANGAIDDITINVFAWAEDIHLAVPTGYNPGTIVPQSGTEYTQGPISTPAAVVADVASKLSMVPIMKPYALATEMVASNVAALAKAFGYSRPVDVVPVLQIKPVFGNYANTNVPDTCQKLTYDIKQETTIDSRVCGLDGTDEMSIRSITTRESWIHSIFWGTTDPVEHTLFSTLVTPIQHREFIDPEGNREFHMSAMCFATLPFKYWRGSLRYRFQVVSSGYHKGRLKISWDPVANPVNEFNVNYTQIVDISTEKDFVITVGWGNKHPFLEYGAPEGSTTTRANGTLTSIPPDHLHNGVLSVSVLNALTAPSTDVNNDIAINVFVSTADDYEVAVPDPGALARYSWLTPPIVEPQSGEEVDSDNSRPVLDGDPKMMGSSSDGTSDIYRIMFGDPITSVRQVVKRYTLHSLLSPGRLQDLMCTFARPDFPYYRGFTIHGVNEGQQNYANMTMLNWFTPAYICRRGGVRWKYHAWNLSNTPNTFVNVARSNRNTHQEELVLFNAATPDEVAMKVESTLSLFGGGTVNPMQQNVAEVEFPFYTNRRFWHAKANNYTDDATETTFHEVSTLQRSGSDDGYTVISAYTAAADDFSLAFFTGAPVMYIYR